MLSLPSARTDPAALVDALIPQLPPSAQLIVPIANGEPVGVLDALEARADELDAVKVHQMHAIRDRPYLHGQYAGHLEHVAWFLSDITRRSFAEGHCEFAPANFSEVPQFLLTHKPCAVIAAASPPDRHGYFSLGVTGGYTAALIGRVPFILEVNPAMPRTSGANRLHRSEVAGWCEIPNTPLVEVPPARIGPADKKIAELIADRVRDGCTIQLGIGAIPTAVATNLVHHRDLGVHTELLSDPIVDLVEAGAVNGVRKRTNRHQIVTTFALGTRRLYDFCHDNDTVQFLPVDQVNDPRNIGREPNFISVNATLEVDLFGQCASETLGTRYYSGSGGQADFARGAQYSEGGDGFVVLHATAKGGTISRIVPRLTSGAVVTTMKNTVDNVVTEYGIAELQGRTLRARAEALISVAAPEHREWLRREAAEIGLVS